MAIVYVKSDPIDSNKKDIDNALRAFKKQCLKEEIIKDYRKHEYFLKKSVRRKEKSIQARLRDKRNK